MATSRSRPSQPAEIEPTSPLNEEVDPVAAAGRSAAPEFNLDDFDDSFDDDFEAEVAGEYEIEDDDFARQLAEMVDFDIAGLGSSDDDDGEGEPDIDAGDARPA